MTDEELDEMKARAGVLEALHANNWAQCPHDRPYERCESCGGEDVFELVAEVRRLRALIARVEWRASNETPGGDAACPWCDTENGVRERNIKHALNCDAFMPDGDVR